MREGQSGTRKRVHRTFRLQHVPGFSSDLDGSPSLELEVILELTREADEARGRATH